MTDFRPTTASPLSRRRLLKASGVVALALAGGSTVLMWGSSEHYRRLLPKGARPTVFSEKELAVLAALCDRILPPAPLSARDARIAERIDRELSFHGLRMVKDFKAAIFLLEHGGWLHGRATRFTRLAAKEQDAALERLVASGTDLERQAFNGIKVVASFFFYCDDRTWKDIGYAGPMIPVRAPPEADSNPLREGER